MEWYVKAFLKASLAWLALGVSLGVAMAVHPVWTVYRLAHIHMVLLGFVTMMIFGVAYHVLPRFAGNPMKSKGAAVAHWWISNVGLAGMAGGFMWRAWNAQGGTWLLGIGGSLSALGAYLFVWLMWRTLDGSRAQREKARAAAVQASTRSSARMPVLNDA